MSDFATVRQRIAAALVAEDARSALRIATLIPEHDLGPDGLTIRRAHEAAWHPRHAVQLGRDPDQLIREGLVALRALIEEYMAKKLTKPVAPIAAKKVQKSTKKASRAAVDTDPAPKAERPPAARSAPPPPLSISTDEANQFKSHGGGRWSFEKDGATITVERDRRAGSWTATVERQGQTASATTKGYASCIRAVVSKFTTIGAGQ